jgi:hypothetical protein
VLLITGLCKLGHPTGSRASYPLHVAGPCSLTRTRRRQPVAGTWRPPYHLAHRNAQGKARGEPQAQTGGVKSGVGRPIPHRTSDHSRRTKLTKEVTLRACQAERTQPVTVCAPTAMRHVFAISKHLTMEVIMAHYDVTYSCGHQDRIQLFGPHKDRQERINWLESQGLCRACYTAKKRAEEKIKGPLFVFRRSYQRGADDQLEVLCTEGSYDIKEELEARGFRFVSELDVAGGHGFMSLTSKPRPGWQRFYSRTECAEGGPGKALLDWITEHKYRIEARNQLDGALHGLALGRPDLVPRTKP